ncbi:MAG: AMP-binding protein [Gemmataceae bacterium]|nr:AMP-binding protein [Gemmataceae bacterium]
MDEPLTDAQRFPLLDETGQRLLRRLQEHPHAPKYNYRVGERLSSDGLAAVRSYAEGLRTRRTGWRFGGLPPWLPPFVEFCRREVPFHRRRADWSEDFFALPPIGRQELRRQPWAFVPDSADLTDLVVYTTSGTTGTRLSVLSHPTVPNRYLPLMQTALAAHGVRLEGGNRVSIVQVCAQRQTYVLCSVMSYLDFAGFVKVNLALHDWRDPDDRVKFLDDCNPEIYTGDPFAYAELMKLPLSTRPKALVSAGTTLLPGLKRELQGHFGCPVIDLYSLNESGPVAYARGKGHEILPHDLYVEVLDSDGRPCPPGVRGEITLTGGNNPFLPLLRYRTQDHAALDFSGPLPMLVGFEGRSPVTFRPAAGQTLNNVDVTIALRDLPLPFFALHQHADGSLIFRTRCDARTVADAERRLLDLFGSGQGLTVEQVPEAVAWGGKSIQYTSDLK